MRPPATNWQSALIAIAMGLAFLILAIAEVRAGEANARAGDSLPPWAVHLQQVDEALARKNMGLARHAWQGAYGAALGSRRWQGMVEVGEASLRIGEAAGDRQAAQAHARRLYRAAFFLARQEGSLDGALVTAEAFARLGDQEIAEICLRTAERIASRSHDARVVERVTEARKRLARLAGR